MPDLPLGRIDARPHGEWTVREDHAGITHFAWKWSSGMTIGYLCCTEPEWLDDVQLPTLDLGVSCLTCMGTIV